MKKLRFQLFRLDYDQDSGPSTPTHWLRWLLPLLGFLVAIAGLVATLATSH